MSRDYSRRSKTEFVAYPAHVVDHTILEGMGLTWGTRPDEAPPKVVMTRKDWDRLVRAIKAVKTKREKDEAAGPHRALLFLGNTWRDNPLIERPANEPKEERPRRRKIAQRKLPSPFAHLLVLPVHQAVEKAREEHRARVAAGANESVSSRTLLKALDAIHRAESNRVIPRPLPIPEGEEPPTPTELRRRMRRPQD